MPELIKTVLGDYPFLAENFPYLLVFFLLYLSGVGLPMPEEPTLLLGGYLIYLRGEDQPGVSMAWPLAGMIATACTAILAGDLTMYWLGRRFGQAFLSHRYMRWIFSKQNRGRIERFYERFGLWAIFCSRFIAGVRLGSFFLAGATKVPLRSFLLMDGLGTLISGPISVWLAFHFGEQIDFALHWLGSIFRNLALLVALVSLLALWWQIRRSRRLATASPPAPGASS